MTLPGAIMKNKLLAAMEAHFGSDRKRIDHARRVLRHAEHILESEPCDRTVVEAAAILHDIGKLLFIKNMLGDNNLSILYLVNGNPSSSINFSGSFNNLSIAPVFSAVYVFGRCLDL